MRITYGLQWGACSTLMLSSLTSLDKWESGDSFETGFVKTLLYRLTYIGTKDHGRDHVTLMEKRRKNTILNFSPVPQNYVGPDYHARQYAWLIASTNNEQPLPSKMFDELGFRSTPKQFNTKNDTYVKLYFIHPSDCIKACEKWLNSHTKDGKIIPECV